MLHKHIVKHAKRAHAHVQDHGHKWLWLLSWVFFFILIYPYFSNAQVPDTCPNWATNEPDCTICAQWYVLDESEQCVEDIRDDINLSYTINNNNILRVERTPVAWYEYISLILNTSDPTKNFGARWAMASGVSEQYLRGDETRELYSITAALVDENDQYVWEEKILQINTDVEAFENWFENISHNRNGDNIEITRTNSIEEERTIMVFTFDPEIQEYQVLWQPWVAEQDSEIYSHPLATWGSHQLRLISTKDVSSEYYQGRQQAGEEILYTINETPTNIQANITGNIVYNPTTSTTGTVTATVTWFSTTGVTVTSSGWATYTFIENGSHTFTFENEDGATGSVIANVDWIAPVQLTTTIQECEIIVQTPTSGSIVAGSFDIAWSADNCNDEEAVTIQLRDHNNQRIDIGTWILEDEEFSFNSTWLASTGFYTITGLHLSGTNRQETSGGVVVASGVYTQDTVYNMYTWAYAGVYTNYATGYKLRLVDENGDVFAESNGTFTIDNQKPVLSNFIVSFAPLVSGQVGRSGIMTASFTSNEQLTGWVTFTILGTTVVPTSGSVSGNTYTYTIPLTSVVASGSLTFTANVADLAANTWSLYGTSATVLNNRIPAINNFMFTTGTVSGSINLSWKTDVATKYNLSYYKSGTAGTTYFTGTTYGTSHTYTMANIQNNNHYPFAITVLDNLSNNNTLQGVLYKSATGSLSISLQSSNDILQLSWQAEANLYLQILQNEINKFQTCKAALTFTNQNIPVANKTVTLKIPTIQNNGVKQTMLAFLLLFTNKVKDKTTLSQVELNTVADAVNNFLVIIKLVDDNGNSCDQKMSTYYLSQFEQLMSSMNFF